MKVEFKKMEFIKKIMLAVIALLISTTFCFAQRIEIKYYDHQRLQHEVEQQKAKVSWERIRNPDGSITTLVKNIKSDKVLNSETYKGNEPSGVWEYPIGGTIRKKDYNFQLIYAESNCANNPELKSITNYFEDQPSIGYQAPKIATGEKFIYQFIGKNMEYPSRARENNITGKVYTAFIINKAGIIENLVVTKGTNVVLDKEAIRVLKKLKFASPALLNGEPVSVCIELPIGFQLQQ